MPIIARFYGLVIKMFLALAEHNPPHIHAVYGDDEVLINIKTGEILEGYLPPRALAMAQEWVKLHKQELIKMWETQDFKTLPPLD